MYASSPSSEKNTAYEHQRASLTRLQNEGGFQEEKWVDLETTRTVTLQLMWGKQVAVFRIIIRLTVATRQSHKRFSLCRIKETKWCQKQ